MRGWCRRSWTEEAGRGFKKIERFSRDAKVHGNDVARDTSTNLPERIAAMEGLEIKYKELKISIINPL